MTGGYSMTEGQYNLQHRHEKMTLFYFCSVLTFIGALYSVAECNCEKDWLLNQFSDTKVSTTRANFDSVHIES